MNSDHIMLNRSPSPPSDSNVSMVGRSSSPSFDSVVSMVDRSSSPSFDFKVSENERRFREQARTITVPRGRDHDQSVTLSRRQTGLPPTRGVREHVGEPEECIHAREPPTGRAGERIRTEEPPFGHVGE
ncbi:hypothetical protein FCV25MIE_23033 [Fagus crenata]